MKKYLSTMALTVGAFLSASSLSSEFGGPPLPDEVIGIWKMVPLDNPDINEVDPWPMPFQWFEFHEDGLFSSIGTTENRQYTYTELETMFAETRATAPRYTWQENFLIVEHSDIPNSYEAWGVNIFRKDSRFSKAGDLVMTLVGGDDGRPVYYRHLTPVKE